MFSSDMTFNTISEINNYMIQNNNNITIIDYIKLINEKLNKNIDLTFMDYYISLINKEDEFCVNIKMYYILKIIITKNINNEEITDIDKDINNYTQPSNNLKRILDNNSLIVNKDYIEQTNNNSNSRGGSNRIDYMLKPNTFKIMMININNARTDNINFKQIFTNYYLFLEYCIKNYNDYQLQFLNKKIEKLDNIIIDKNKDLVIKDDKISKLENDIQTLIKMSGHVIKQNDNIIEQNNNILKQNDNLENEITETRYIFEEGIQDVQAAINEHLVTNNVNPENPQLHHNYALIQDQTQTNILKFIRGTDDYIQRKLATIYTGYNVVVKEYNPNPIDLFNRIKTYINNMHDHNRNEIMEASRETGDQDQRLREYNNNLPISYRYNTITNNINLDRLITIITNLANENYNLNIPYPRLPDRRLSE